MKQPLTDIRVIDATTRWGELAGRTLAELGAEVFKFEALGEHDSASVAPHHGDESLYRACVLAGKKTVAATDVTPYLADADVLIETGRSGDYGDAFPHLVHVSISPFGSTGPMSEAPAAEITVEAAGGLINLQGDADRPPTPMGAMPQAAFHAGVQAAADAMIALYERERSGHGQHLDVSAQACVVWTLMNATGYPPNTGGNPPSSSERRGQLPPAAAQRLRLPGIVTCKDGFAQVRFQMRHIGERTFDALLRWVEASAAAVPETVRGLDLTHWMAELAAGTLDLQAAQTAADLIVELLATKTKQEIQSYAAAHGLTLAAIYTVEDLLVDPHLTARNFWLRQGDYVYAGPFARLSRTPLSAERSVQHVAAPSPAPSQRSPRALEQPHGAFEGLRVADFSWVGVGPMIGKALADHGATVVRIESPDRLDLLRASPPFKDGEPGPDRSQFMANFNTSKLGITVDLKNPEGRLIGRRMADWADVVLESYSPGTMARFGLDWQRLSADRDDLVMLSTSMRGQTGPRALLLRIRQPRCRHRWPLCASRLAGSPAMWPVGRVHGFHHPTLRHQRPSGGAAAPAPHRRGPVHRPLANRLRHPFPRAADLGLRRQWQRGGAHGAGVSAARHPRRLPMRRRTSLPRRWRGKTRRNAPHSPACSAATTPILPPGAATAMCSRQRSCCGKLACQPMPCSAQATSTRTLNSIIVASL